MKPAILWTAQARQDLIDIYVTIGLDNASAAERMYTLLERRVNSLGASPRMGVRRPEIAPSARMLVEGMYLILYELRPDHDEVPVTEIEIVRIVHGHRDLTRLF